MTARSDRPSLLRYLLYLVVAAAVIPYGAVTAPVTHAVALFAGVAGVVVALVVGENPDARWTTRTAVALAAGLVAYGLWQIAPEWSGAYAAPIWSEAADLIGPLPASVSVAPGGGTAALVTLVLPFVVFATALSLSRTDEAGERILNALILLGLAFAVFGLIQRALQPEMVLFARRIEYIGNVTGTFVNRNTAATFLGVVLVLQLARLGAQASQIDWRSVLPRLFEPHGLLTAAERRFAWSAAGAIVVTLALLMTLSRAGVIATVGALALLLPILQIGYGKSRRSVQNRWRWIFGSIASWLVLGLLLSIFGGQTLMRIQLQGTDDMRFCVYESMVKAIADALPFGSGFGAFAETFPAYRDAACSVDGIWERAHNVFLEGMLGFGWVFVAACVIGATVLVAGYVRGIWKRRRYRWAGAAGLSVLFLVSLHGLLDFSLQIPGMAVYTAAILGAASGLSLGRPGLRSKTPEPSSEPVLTRRLDPRRATPADPQRRRPRPMVARAEVRRSAPLEKPATDEAGAGDGDKADETATGGEQVAKPTGDRDAVQAKAVPSLVGPDAEADGKRDQDPAAPRVADPPAESLTQTLATEVAPETIQVEHTAADRTDVPQTDATPELPPAIVDATDIAPSAPPVDPSLETPPADAETSHVDQPTREATVADRTENEDAPTSSGPEASVARPEAPVPNTGPATQSRTSETEAGETATEVAPPAKPSPGSSDPEAASLSNAPEPEEGTEPASKTSDPASAPSEAAPSEPAPTASESAPPNAALDSATEAAEGPAPGTSGDGTPLVEEISPSPALAPEARSEPEEPAASAGSSDRPIGSSAESAPLEVPSAVSAQPTDQASSSSSATPTGEATSTAPASTDAEDRQASAAEPTIPVAGASPAPAAAPPAAADKPLAYTPRSSLFGRLLLTVVAVAFVAFSGTLVLENARFRSLDHLGTAIWKRAVVPDDVLARASERVADAAAKTCRPNLVKSAVVVALANLDRQDPTLDYGKWEAAVLAARKSLLRRLSCVPGDGDSWARLALVESTIADDPVRTTRLLALSQRTAPVEPGAISARFAAWKVGRARHFRLAHDVFVADLRTVLIHYRLERIRSFIEPLPPAAAPYILEVARDLSYERARRLGRFDIALPRPKL